MSLSDVGSLFRRSGFQDVLVRTHASRHSRNAFGSPKHQQIQPVQVFALTNHGKNSIP